MPVPPRREFVFTATGKWEAGAGAVALILGYHAGWDGTGARGLPRLPGVARELPCTWGGWEEAGKSSYSQLAAAASKYHL